MSNLIPAEIIEQKIYLIRGQKVMLDRDLAKLYGVKTFVLNQSVKRNIERFPEDFMFSLTREEILRISQIVISSENEQNTLKFSKSVNAFTENGIAMLSSVLHSKNAIAMNIEIMRIFTRLRQIILSHKNLLMKVEELEKETKENKSDIRAIFEAIRQMLSPPEDPKKKIGFLR